jgi:hypothetical protein
MTTVHIEVGDFPVSRVLSGGDLGYMVPGNGASASRGAIFVPISSDGHQLMALFDDRKKGQESKYAHDQEMRFKITVRRNKLLGLWLAEQFGLSGVDADAYAQEVVVSDFERPGDDDVVEKVLADCAQRGVDLDEHKIRRHMQTLEAEATAQVNAE